MSLIVTAALIAGCAGGAQPPDGDAPITPNADGTVSTIAGTGAAGFSGDGGHARDAMFNQPMDIAVTTDNRLLIADYNNHRIRSIDLDTGRITTVAGTGLTTGNDALPGPTDVTPLTNSDFLVTCWSTNQVFEITLTGERLLRAGTGAAECSATDNAGDPLAAATFGPRSIAVLADLSLLIGEQGCNRIRRVRDDSITLYAGTGEPGNAGDDGPAVMAMLHAGPIGDGPSFGIALSPEDPPDELFVADTANNVIRQVKPFTGRIERLAGSGEVGFLDGPPELAHFNRPTHVYSGRDHSVWVVDAGNHAIRLIDPLGTRVETVAGTGTAGFNGDNLPPTETQLRDPTGVWMTPDGWVVIADAGNHRIRLFKR